MNAPLVLAIGTAGLALILGGSRLGRVPAALIAGLGCLTLGAISLLVPLDVPLEAGGLAIKFDASLEILGRALELEPGIRSGVGFVFVVGGYLFLGGMVADPGRYFFPMGVLAVGLLAAALMVRPFLYSAVLVQLAAAAFVLVLAPPDRHAERAALRLLAFTTLGMMMSLMAAWLIGRLGVTSGSPERAGSVIPVLALGLAVLLFVPPFHLWLPPGADRAHPYALASVAGLMQAAGLFLVLRVLDSYAWVRDDPGVRLAMTAAGIVMIALGSVWALAQDRLARTFVYVLLIDMGIGMIALGSASAVGYQLAMGMSAARVVGLGAWGLGATLLTARTGTDELRNLRGMGFVMPLPAILTLAGVLSIAGFPLTAGFPG
ncbi:MAG: hypothetical protein MUO23_04085, partial [Anaerolineales bacterium]|nr:hypothetical protein [Anaerolineales bacterium]